MGDFSFASEVGRVVVGYSQLTVSFTWMSRPISQAGRQPSIGGSFQKVFLFMSTASRRVDFRTVVVFALNILVSHQR